MSQRVIRKIHEHQNLLDKAAAWFHEKWGVPEEAYRESMADSCKEGAVVPRWYICMEGDEILGGMGVIENDFHERKDLAPNVCAVFTEPKVRGRGIAGELLQAVCDDMKAGGIDTLYLLTDHIGFYERYGWEFFDMAKEEGEESYARVYIHRASSTKLHTL